MELRALTEQDLTALLDLCQQTLTFDHVTRSILERRALRQPLHEPRHQLGVWDGGRLVGALLSGIREVESERVAWIRLLAVDPAYRRRGVASGMLAELEPLLRSRGIRRLLVGGSAPNYFWPGIDVRYTAGVCFLLAHGFHRSGEAVDMLVDLSRRDWDTAAEEARLAREGYTIRRLLPEDREAFAAWMAAHWSPVWRAEALESYENRPASTFVAVRDGQFCAFASYNVTMFENSFGPTGTLPEHRGRGLGRVLFYRCMQDLKAQGHETADICWVGPIAFYARVADAWIHRVFWFMEKEL
ncbi:MAG: hypothetical protein Kow0047_13570 [Anaerolineae bacterium]